MPEPTDTTAARRDLLALLLDRVERGALLDSERPLLRPLVLAEQGAADARESVMERSYVTRAEQADSVTRHTKELLARADRAESTVYRVRQTVREAAATALPGSDLDRFVQQMTATLDGPSPTGRTFYRATDGEDMHAAYMDGQAALARVRAKVAEWREWDEQETAWAVRGIEQAISNEPEPGPSPTPDDTPATPDGEELPRDDGRPTCRQMPTRTCPDSYNGAPCGDRPCARFESEDPTPWIPDGTPTAVADALRAGHTVTVATSEGVFCSPLVNQQCPGHTDGARCERAPSPKPAVEDEWTCQSTDGDMCFGRACEKPECTPSQPRPAAPTFQITCPRCSALVPVAGDVTLVGDGNIPGHTCLLAADATAEQQ